MRAALGGAVEAAMDEAWGVDELDDHQPGEGGTDGASQLPTSARGGGPQKAHAAEWAYVRVINKSTGVELAPNTVGASKQFCRCVFCGNVASAQVNRIRDHIGGVKGAVHSKACRGPRRSDNETELSFSHRTAQFVAARVDCCRRAAEIRAAAYAKQQEVLLDSRTSGESAMYACMCVSTVCAWSPLLHGNIA
jgi:hypothetical protein